MATNSNLKTSAVKTHYMIAALMALFCISETQAKLSILSPRTFNSKFVGKSLLKELTSNIGGTIKASYANFGYIPYGHSIVSLTLAFNSVAIDWKAIL